MATPTDLSKLSIEELNALINAAIDRREELVQEKRSELMRQLAELDAVGKPSKAATASSKRASPQPKYRSKENPESTWVGRGGTPRWLKTEMSKTGEPLEAFLIK